MGVITVDACAGYAYAAGFRGSALSTITAIAGPESGYDTTQLNDNPKTGDLSYGLWQINMYASLGPARRKQFALKANTDLFDPATNARAAWSISSGGTNFDPWTTFKKGLHRPYLANAQAAADSVTARSGAAVDAGGLPLEASTTGVVAGEILPPAANLGFGIANVATVFPRPGLNGATVAEMERLGRMGVAGSVSLSVSSVAEVQMTFPDPLGEVQSWRYFLLGAEARLGDLRLVVAATEWTLLDNVPALVVTFRPIAVDGLRSTDPKSPSVMWSNLSPTEVLAERAAFVGLRFYGKGTPRRTQIVRLGVDDTGAATDASSGRKVAETDWDMGQRLAREEGFWFFESGDALYFAPPTWLAAHTTSFEARYEPLVTERIWAVLGFPDCRATLDDNPYGVRAISRTITMDMPRWRGEQVRAGMRCNFRGIPGYDTKIDNTGPAEWVVTNVGWPFDGGQAPVSVELTEAIDPVPEPAADDGTTVDDTAGTAGPPGAASATGVNFPTGTGVSNQGKGSYGLQYDPVGTSPATGPQPGTVILYDHLLAKFTQAKGLGIFNPRKVDGTSTLSVHAEGRAGDTGAPTSSNYGLSIAGYLVANASLFGIQVVIWDARIWTSKDSTWRTFKAANGKTDATSLHRDHIHWENCWEAARYLNATAISGANSG